jgi:O-antigen ligase
VYFAAMLTSTFFSVDVKASFIKLLAEMYLIGLAVLAFNLIDDENDLKQVAKAWLCGAIVPVVIALLTLLLFYAWPGHPLLEYTTYHYGAVPVGNYPRLSSTFVSASMFCNYLNVSLVILFIARERRWIGKAAFLIFSAAILICSVFTISAGLGGIFLSAGIWVWLVLRDKKPVAGRLAGRLALAGGIGIAVLFLALNFFALQNTQVIGGETTYLYKVPGTAIQLQPSSRMLVWSDAIKTFSENPLTGKGLGQPVSNVVFQNTDGSHSLLTDAHNVFLSVAAQCGLAGLVTILALAGYILWAGFGSNLAINRGAIILKGLGIAFLSAFVYQGLTGSFEDARHLWVLIGIIPAVEAWGRGVSKI